FRFVYFRDNVGVHVKAESTPQIRCFYARPRRFLNRVPKFDSWRGHPVRASETTLHGKEGVDGSSPSEALQKPRSQRLSFRIKLQILQRGQVRSPFMEPSVRNRHSIRDANEQVSTRNTDQACW